MKRAVIAGLGIISSIGNNQQEALASPHEGHPGITPSQEFKGSGMRSHVWGNAKLDTTGLTDRKVVRFMSDASIYACLPMEQVVANASLAPEIYQSDPHVGSIAGSGSGSPKFQVFGADVIHSPHGLKVMGPCVVAKTTTSGISAYLATLFKIHDVNYSISSAYVTSAHYIDNAVEQIQLGKQGIVFVGGGEELCWEMAYESDAMGVLPIKYNDTPEKTSRTYDMNRDGFIIAGGGGMVVAGGLEHTLACGAHTYTGVVGYGITSDGADMVAPSGEGAVRHMQATMHGVDTPINYLNSHGTSTPIGDVKKLGAIREVLGDNSSAISVTKAMTGHSLDAAGVQEAVYFLLILEYGLIVPSINVEELNEQAAGLDIITKPTGVELTTVMSSGLGFGGTSVTLVIHKYNA